MKNSMPQLKDGDDYQLNRMIVGDEEGLKNLIKACEIAIESGECLSEDLDNYNGVCKRDTEFLERDNESKLTPIVFAIIVSLFAFSLFLIVIGFVNFITWF